MLVKRIYNLETLITKLELGDIWFSFLETKVLSSAPWKYESKVYNINFNNSPHIIEIIYLINDDMEENVNKAIDEITSSDEFKNNLYNSVSLYFDALRSYKKKLKKLIK